MDGDRDKLYYECLSLKPENFKAWKILMTSHLKSKGLWPVCVSRITKKESDAQSIKSDTDEIDDITALNEKAKFILYRAIGSVNIISTGICETAFDLWNKIEENFEGKEDDRKNAALYNFLNFSYKEDESLLTYCGRFEACLQSLILTECLCEERTKTYTFMKTMPEKMKNKAELFLLANPKTEVTTLISFIKGQILKNELEESTAAATVLLSNVTVSEKPKKDFKHNKLKETEADSNSSSKITCTYCKKLGHPWQKCRKRLAKRAEKDKKRSSQSPKENDLAFVTINDEFGYGIFPNEELHGKTLWIIDSGASCHMTCNDLWLEDFKPEPNQVQVGDGKPLQTLGKGTFRHSKGLLNNVLLVPKLKYNLFSISAAARYGGEALFSKNNVIISKPNKPPLRGSRYSKGLYAIELTLLSSPKKALIASSKEDWHRKFGHASTQIIDKLIQTNAVIGLDISNKTNNRCTDCSMSKICRVHHPQKSLYKQITSQNNLVVHADTVGKIQPESLDKYNYLVICTVTPSTYKYIKCVHTKDQIKTTLKTIITQIELDSTKKVRMLVTDNGSEFKNQDLGQWLEERGILHEFSTPYVPQQNGTAERSNRTIIESARTMLKDSNLSNTLWSVACETAVYLQNRLIPSNSDKTRYELFLGEKPIVANLHIFGEYAVCKINDKKNEKFATKGVIARFVGYTRRYNTFTFLNQANQKFFKSCDAVFLGQTLPKKYLSEQSSKETTNDFASMFNDEDYEQINKTDKLISTGKTVNNNKEAKRPDLLEQASNSPTESQSKSNQSTPERPNMSPLTPRIISPTAHISFDGRLIPLNSPGNMYGNLRMRELSPTSPLEEPQPSFLQQLGNLILPNQSNDSNDLDVADIVCVASQTTKPPQNLKEAQSSEDWPQWREAIKKEVNILNVNNTFLEMTRPKAAKIIKSRWVFTTKNSPDGTTTFKARLVAKGFTQRLGVDYTETFAPVASLTIVRIFLAIVCQYNLSLAQIDVTGAFLHGDLDHEIYLQPPEGLYSDKNLVWKLNKSLYGLKQSPRLWNRKFHNFLMKYGLKNTLYEKCLYVNEAMTIFMVIYVDDALIAAKQQEVLAELIECLKLELELRELGGDNFLSLKLERTENTLKISQKAYVEKILERFEMANCKPIKTPEGPAPPDQNAAKLNQEVPFKEAIGSLLYLTTATRPDISHAVNIVSRTGEPTVTHWSAVKRILRYLKGTPNLGIEFRRLHTLRLEVWSDADYANDKETRRSTTGYLITINSAPVAWKSQRQASVSLSTAEAEYISASEAAKELLPIRRLLHELKLIDNTPTPIYIDNLSTIFIAKDEGQNTRSKHVDVRTKWMKEMVEERTIKPQHVASANQKADILTKALGRVKFEKDRQNLLALPTHEVYIYPTTNLNKNKWLVAAVALVAMFSLAESVSLGSPQKLVKVLFETLRGQAPNIVNYKLTDIAYLDYYTDSVSKITLINPCDDLFGDITHKKEWNAKLDELCEAHFKIAIEDGIDTCRHFTTNHTVQTKVKYYGIGLKGQMSETGSDNYPMEFPEYPKIRQIHKEARNNTPPREDIDDSVRQSLFFLEPKPDNFNTIIAIVQDLTDHLKNVNQVLNNVEAAAKRKKASIAYSKLFSSSTKWHKAIAEGSTLHGCNLQRSQNKDYTFNYAYSFPVRDHSAVILKAQAFQIWNQTKSQEFCWLKYGGPEYVMYNTSNNCYLTVNPEWINHEAIAERQCLIESQKLASPPLLFYPERCYKNHSLTEKEPQVHEFDGKNYIYCPGKNLTLDNKLPLPCPDHVVPLDRKIKFNISGYTHEQDSFPVENPLERLLSKEITEQLDIKRAHKYGLNSTEFNSNRTIYNFLPKLTILNPLDFKDVKQMFQDSLPVQFIQQSIDGLWSSIKIILYILSSLIILYLVWCCSPLTTLLFFFLSSLAKIITKGMPKARRFSTNAIRTTKDKVENKNLKIKRMVENAFRAQQGYRRV